MFVVTADQRDSRRQADAVGEILTALSPLTPVAGFERTVGDEVQGLLDDPEQLARALDILLRDGRWHIGVGVGEVDGVPSSVREGRGPAFLHARAAVDEAKKREPSISVCGGRQGEREALDLVLRLTAVVYGRRSEAQWEVVDLLAAGLTGVEVADKLGVSPAAVSQRRRTAAYDVTADVTRVIADLATRWGSA